MYFIVGLPRTQSGFDAIWVIINPLMKPAHFFLPCKVTASMEVLIELYIKESVRLHGIPTSIVANKDPQFTFRFWQSLQKEMWTTLNSSITYHP